MMKSCIPLTFKITIALLTSSCIGRFDESQLVQFPQEKREHCQQLNGHYKFLKNGSRLMLISTLANVTLALLSDSAREPAATGALISTGAAIVGETLAHDAAFDYNRECQK